MAIYLRRLVVTTAWLLFFASTSWAQSGSVTLAWDPNSEPDIARYNVFWGTQSGVYTNSVNAGNVTAYTFTGLTHGQTYYFAVQAVNSVGLTSPLSQEVVTTVPNPDTNPYGETTEQWKTRFRLTDMTADDDGDGARNDEEFRNGTDPTLPNNWHLAEGCVGFFATRLALANPGTDTAEITVTFFREGAEPIVREFTVPGLTRTSMDTSQIPGLYGYSFSTTIQARRGGIVVERTMTWGGGRLSDAGHTGKAVRQPNTTWYFAEGQTRSFDSYLLLANANTADTTVTVTYLLESGAPVQETYAVPAESRRTIHVNEVRGVAGKSFAMKVEATLPITAERSVYFNARGRFWKGGHASVGAEAPSTTWFVAEGRTGSYFEEDLLIANPNASATTATVRFLRPAGEAVTKTYTLSPMSRTTIRVDEIPELGDTEVSASVTATQPVVVERSMYWPGTPGEWYESHNSLATAQAGIRWAMAEGQHGGNDNTNTYILLANPTNSDSNVVITILRDNLPPIIFGRTVRANSRLTLASGDLPLGQGEKFGFTAESTNLVPFVVERSMYWDAIGARWAAGTNETGIRLR